MALKVTTADKWFSKCVRIRTNWKCQKCGVVLEHDPQYLHCSHFISRSKLTTRYHPLNALAHCYKCHEKLGGGRWGGGNVADFAYHYELIMGSKNREYMRRLAQYSFNFHDGYLKEIAKHYRLEFKRMDNLRKQGVIKNLDFEFFTGSLELNGIIKQIKLELSQEANHGNRPDSKPKTFLYRS